MHFIIVNHYATTPEYNGGTRHFDIAKELISNGHEVTIIASSFNHFSKLETKSFKGKFYLEEQVEGIRFIWIKTASYKSNLKRLLNILSFYKNGRKFVKYFNFENRPGVVIGSTVHLLAAQLGLDISKKYGSKFLFEERDLWPQTFIDFGKLSEKNIIAKILYKYESYFYKHADKIIVLFEKAKDYVESKNVDTEKVIHLPNGFSDKIKSKLPTNKELLNLLNEDCIVYIGSHGIANELDKILDLSIHCNELNINFIFIGDGLEKQKLMKRKMNENLKNVHFFNPIAKNEVHAVLLKSRMSIISIKNSPLYKYGFSMNKIFDYLYSCKPIVMLADKNLAKEFDKPGINVGLNLNEQCSYIEKLLIDNKFFEEECNNVKKISYNYSWTQIIKKLLIKL